jgi:hypothetical protein
MPKMNKTKYIKGACQHCGGHLEFLAEHVGMVVPCPHCQQETELLLLPLPEEPTVPRRALIWTGIAVLVLVLGLVGALAALRRAQRWAQSQKTSTASLPAATSLTPAPTATNSEPNTVEPGLTSTNGLVASSVKLEKTKGSSLIYAVGKISNTSDHKRFGVKVELELSNASGKKVGTASDYLQILEAGSDWQFKALVVDSKTTSARIVSIREDQ